MRVLFNGCFGLVFLCTMVVCSTSGVAQSGPRETDSPFIYDRGAITRGDRATRKLALVFTGDEFADGADSITEVFLMLK
jgi:endoglucanase